MRRSVASAWLAVVLAAGVPLRAEGGDRPLPDPPPPPADEPAPVVRRWRGLQPGDASAGDVAALLGQPTSRSQAGQLVVLSYRGPQAPAGAREVRFTLSADGVVEEISVFLASPLDTKLVEGAFGQPGVRSAASAVTPRLWSYPQLGVAVAFNLSGKAEVVRYGAAPARAAGDPWSPTRTPPGAQPAPARTATAGPPSFVKAHAISDRAAGVEWGAPTDGGGVTSYQIVRDGVAVAALPASDRSFEETGLTPARRYCYTVVAVGANDRPGLAGGPACLVTPDLTPPAPPTELTSRPRSTSELVLSWRAAVDDVGVKGYEVLREGGVVATVEGTTWLAGGLAAEAEACFQLRAFDAAGHRSEPAGPACARTSPSGTPAAPSNLRAEVSGADAVELRWDPSPTREVVYVVYWATDRGERHIGVTARPAFRVSGLAATDPRCFSVSAQDGAHRESPRSVPACSPGTRSRPLAVGPRS